MSVSWWWDIEKLMNINEKLNATIQIILTDVSLEISNNAKENAPYLTWSLRRSISPDFNYIKRWFSVVWSPLNYAWLREYVNNRNPQTKYYLKRAFTEHEWEITKIILEDLNLNIKK